MKGALIAATIFGLAGFHGHVGVDYELADRIYNGVCAFGFIIIGYFFLEAWLGRE